MAVSLFSCFFTVTTVSAESTAAPVSQYKKIDDVMTKLENGEDVNKDGKTDLLDVNYLARHLAGWEAIHSVNIYRSVY